MKTQKIKRFSSPPPAIGWWPAGLSKSTGFYRWWDGDRWSKPATKTATRSQVQKAASEPSLNNGLIKWRHWSVEIDGTDGVGAHE